MMFRHFQGSEGRQVLNNLKRIPLLVERKKGFVLALAVLLLVFSVTNMVLMNVTLARLTTVMSVTGAASTEGSASICIGRRPEMGSIGDQTATAGSSFSLQVATTFFGANTSVTYTDDTRLFTISNTGAISFTPASGDVGTHTIEITVTDSSNCPSLTATRSFLLTINAAAADAGAAGTGGYGYSGGGGGTTGGGRAAGGEGTEEAEGGEKSAEAGEEAEAPVMKEPAAADTEKFKSDIEQIQEHIDRNGGSEAVAGQALAVRDPNALETHGSWNTEGSASLQIRDRQVYSLQHTHDGVTEYHGLVATIDGEAQTVTLVIMSEPVVVTLKVGEATAIDLDGDQEADLTITLQEVHDDGTVTMQFEKSAQWKSDDERIRQERLTRLTIIGAVALIALVLILIGVHLASVIKRMRRGG